MSRPSVVIIGTGGLGRETLWSVRATGNADVAGFLTHDTHEHGTEVDGVRVLGHEEWVVRRPETRAICAIADPRARRQVVHRLAEQGVRFATVVPTSVERSASAELGEGCIVGAKAILTTQVRVGAHVVIGVGVTVSHDAVVEDFATLGPSAVLCGHAHIEAGAEVGPNSTIARCARVGRGALVGAHSLVLRDIESNTVAIGVPVRTIRRFQDTSLF